MKFFSGIWKQVNKTPGELLIIKMKTGRVGLVFWDGLFKEFSHLVRTGPILIVLIELKTGQFA